MRKCRSHLGQTFQFWSRSFFQITWRQPSHFTHKPSVRTRFSLESSRYVFSRLNQDISQLPVASTQWPVTDSGEGNYQYFAVTGQLATAKTTNSSGNGQGLCGTAVSAVSSISAANFFLARNCVCTLATGNWPLATFLSIQCPPAPSRLFHMRASPASSQ